MNSRSAAPPPTLTHRLHSFQLSGLAAHPPSDALYLVLTPPSSSPQRSPAAGKPRALARQTKWPDDFSFTFNSLPPRAARQHSPTTTTTTTASAVAVHPHSSTTQQQPQQHPPPHPHPQLQSNPPSSRRSVRSALRSLRLTRTPSAHPARPSSRAHHVAEEGAASSVTIALVAVRRLRGAAGFLEIALGHVSVSLYTLATGPRHHALELRQAGAVHAPPASPPLCLSFDAVSVEVADVALSLHDVSVSVSRPVSAPYLIVGFHRATEDTLEVAQTRSARARAYLESNRANRGGDGNVEMDVLAVSAAYNSNTANPTWEALPALVLPRCSLAALAHGYMSIRLHDGKDGTNVLLASRRIPFHQIFYTSRFTLDLRPAEDATSSSGQLVTGGTSAAVSASIVRSGVPQTAQMLGGVHSDRGITGARPVIFGVPLPITDKPISSGVCEETAGDDSVDEDDHRGNTAVTSRATSCGSSGNVSCPCEEDERPAEDGHEETSSCRLPQGWNELVDSFSYRYWHNSSAAAAAAARDSQSSSSEMGTQEHQGQMVDSWVRPDANGVVHDPNQELIRDFGVERVSGNRFRSTTDGTECWIHPRACRISGLPRAPTVPPTRALNEKVRKDKDRPVAEAHEQESSVRRGLSLVPRVLTDERGLTTDMRWSFSNSSVLGCPGTEGHSLTRLGDRGVLKFGGAAGDGSKLNSVFSLDPSTLRWRELPAVGALPEGRVGHGAIPLGTDKMLVFGGTSRLGRLNDMHVFHEGLNAWSPVACCGERPAPRARLGMAAWRDSALVFGGREGYMYMADRYFSDVHCFNPRRSEWIRVETRGTGPSARCGMAVEVLNERLLFVHGGFDENKYFSETWLLDTVSCTWQRPPYQDPSLEPSSRESHASTVFGNSVLVYGGEGEGAWCSDLFVFDADRLRWTGAPVVTGHSPGARSGPALSALDDTRVVMVGGSTGYQAMNDTHVLDTQFVSLRDVEGFQKRGMARGPDAESCVVCLDNRPSVMFAFCGHSVLCSSCAKRDVSVCPICRQPIGKMVPVIFE